MQEAIKKIFDGLSRFRAATLQKHFTPEQIEYINTFAGDTFKIKFLRAAGLGSCKQCGANTDYIEKIRFYAFCSKDCENKNNRESRTLSVLEQFKAYGLTCLDIENYANHGSILKFSCKAKGHEFSQSLYNIDYIHQGCNFCTAEEREKRKISKIESREKELIILKEAYKEKSVREREESKQQLIVSRRAQVGTLSNIACKACGKFTKFTLLGAKRLYGPKFCDDICVTDFEILVKKKKHTNRIAKLNSSDIIEYKSPINNDISSRAQHLVKFVGCGHEYPVIFRNLLSGPGYTSNLCPDCNRFSPSSIEVKLINVLIKTGTISTDSFIVGSRKLIYPKEIDIYLPEHKIGIEVNGTWWHSDLYKDQQYHISKTIAAEEKGITLYHFYCDEIENNIDAIIGMIKGRMGLLPKIGARSCEVLLIDSSISKPFLDTNHLQGSANASVHVGLFLKDELVAVMTFRRPFIKHHDAKWEIARFAVKSDLAIMGAGSKLLTFFERNYKGKIITFADRRYSQGKLYQQLGFKFSHFSAPGFYYLVNGERFNRMEYQKHKILKMLNLESSELTEEELMLDLGYPRVYDCGQSVWIKE